MGLPDILETIRSESEATASALIGDAEAAAEQLLARARTEAALEEERLAAGLDDRIRQERARVLSLSHLEAARARRAAREDVYEKAVDGVARRLAEIRSSPDYGTLMGSLLDEAVATLPGATTVRVDPADEGLVRDLLASRRLEMELKIEETPKGGLVLVAPGRTVDNRLATRLGRADTHLRFIAGEIIPGLRGGSS